MVYSPWKLIKLDEILEINPRISLKKGEVAKKIAMADIKEFTRKVQHYEFTEFKSGSKFLNNDTLMARITPCLENGKTAFMNVLDDNEAAFGSTEFFILRAKETLADPKFIYYLSITEELRSVAIQSMTGTSGRQRAQRESILNYEMRIPPIGIQKKIGEILSILDDKIELNLESISTLEQLAQTLFKRWFVDFDFPNEKGEPYKSSGGEMAEGEFGIIPKDWEVVSLREGVKIQYGKSMPMKKLKPTGYPVYGANGVIGFTEEFLYEEAQVIMTCRGNGSGDVFKTVPKSFVTNNSLVLEDIHDFGLDFLRLMVIGNNPYNFKTGSAQPQITITNIGHLKIVLPIKGVLKDFDEIMVSIFDMGYSYELENEKLKKLRDALLPKLLSGEIEIPDEIEVNENVPIS